jgi:hypothetical protein
MGADIYLRSIATEEVQKAIVDDLVAADVDRTDPHARFAAIGQYYERLAETGGYFRDPYNESALLPALGMEWVSDVGPMLDVEGPRKATTPSFPSLDYCCGSPIFRRRGLSRGYLRR